MFLNNISLVVVAERFEQHSHESSIHIYFILFFLRENSISRLSFYLCVAIFLVCQFLFIFFRRESLLLFVCGVFVNQSRSQIRLYTVFFMVLSSLPLSPFPLFSLSTVIQYLFVCFFIFVFICTSNFHQNNLWWAQKKTAQMAEFIQIDRWSLFLTLALSICSRKNAP